MSLTYLPEHAEAARLSLGLAKRELAHLAYSHRSLFAAPIDLAWVKRLGEREDLAEKIDAFVSRFSRLQDHIGDKLLPAFAKLTGSQPKSLLDVLVYGERMAWVDSAEDFVGARKLRNMLVHEYIEEAEFFLEALQTAKDATKMLISIVERIDGFAESIKLPP